MQGTQMTMGGMMIVKPGGDVSWRCPEKDFAQYPEKEAVRVQPTQAGSRLLSPAGQLRQCADCRSSSSVQQPAGSRSPAGEAAGLALSPRNVFCGVPVALVSSGNHAPLTVQPGWPTMASEGLGVSGVVCSGSTSGWAVPGLGRLISLQACPAACP